MPPKRRKKSETLGEKVTFADVLIGDTVLVNGDFRTIKEIITRDKDESLGLSWEGNEGEIWRLPTYPTQRIN